MSKNTFHKVTLTEGQIGIILCSLENSVKYADSDYITEVDTIFEELEGTIDKYMRKSKRPKVNSQIWSGRLWNILRESY